MRILFDTSMLIAAVVEGHPAHDAAFPWLQRVKDKTDDFRRVYPALADKIISPLDS